MSYDQVPQDLHELNYSRKILDDLGLPAKGNLELVADCIAARAKQVRQPMWEAYKFIHRMAVLAQERGTKVDRWWFQNGDYLHTEIAKETPFKGSFQKVDREATDREQATPEWEEANQKLRGLLKQIADGKYPPKEAIRKDPKVEQEKLSKYLKERRNDPAITSSGESQTKVES